MIRLFVQTESPLRTSEPRRPQEESMAMRDYDATGWRAVTPQSTKIVWAVMPVASQTR
jgi:hypothetical protein